MVENRELGIEDYLAALRRRSKALLIPILLSPIAGFLVSYAFPPRYTSQSLILIENQTVPTGYVKPVVTEDITQRIATMQQQVLSRKSLQPMIERLGLVTKKEKPSDVIQEIRDNIDVEPVQPGVSSSSSSPSSSSSTSTKKKPLPGNPNTNDIPGFTIAFTTYDPVRAQKICGELSSMFLEENLKQRAQVAQDTTDFLTRQVDESKRNLDDQDSKLAAFKKQNFGQLPTETDANLKILSGLNSQLDSNTQTLNRAQQDKTYAEALLSQDIAAWKASQSEDNPQSIEQQLTKLQSNLIELQSRYTDDYPDVSKTKKNIAELQKKLKEINSAPLQTGESSEKASANEPAEIRQLRVQIHQYADVIAQATREQKRLQDSINTYESRLALSPGVEEQYKGLTRDYETALDAYNDLLSKRGLAQVQSDMERQQEGEQMRLLNSANLPDQATFPTRWMLALGGLGAGLATGMVLTILLEFQDKSLRDEKDILASLELPMLVAVPWVGSDGGNRNWSSRLRRSGKETVEV